MPQWNPISQQTIETLRNAAGETRSYAETIASADPENAPLQQMLAFVQEQSSQVETLCTEHDRFRQFWEPKTP